MSDYIVFDPIGRRIPCTPEDTVLAVARRAGIRLVSVCGGRTGCGRCRVRIVSGEASALSDAERSRLSVDEIDAGFRLACAAKPIGSLRVEIPPTSLRAAGGVLLSGDEPQPAPDPVIIACDLTLTDSASDRPVADWGLVTAGLGAAHGLENIRPDIEVLRALSGMLRNHDWRVTVLIRDEEAVAVQPQDAERLGVAFDVGTTTIAAYLVDLDSGATVAVRGAENPQAVHGEDVMSRISFALEHGAAVLREAVLAVMNDSICEMVDDPETIVESTIVGNTAMHHLLLGLPVAQLGMAPYLPALSDPLDVKARDLGLHLAPGAYAHLLPNIGGFVGADHVSMLLASRVHETEKTVIGIDIGTNTEVTLAAGGALTSLSCASGPAFEGAGISHGMRAAGGAIDSVRIEGDELHLSVIGGARPVGICGSGIVDALSELRRCGIMNPRGRLDEHLLVRNGGDGPEFVLALRDGAGADADVVVTQRDIEQVQVAKAAIRAGIDVLLDDAGVSHTDIDEVAVAGAFGQSMDPASAVGIGLFPPIRADRFRKVGNAAGAGAKLALISSRERTAARTIARRAKHLELTTHPGFSSQFSDALPFPRHVGSAGARSGRSLGGHGN